ncbi:hypothetical protein [Terrarubrum flagellatum]|uniref:hypothetical protein n=1 Tax=Terrirubrum flagellatum TaxID=2895980 RepID=UPI00314535D6
MRRAAALIGCIATGLVANAAFGQQTRDLGLPPPFDNPALPPAVNPALPPPTGQRYLPGTTGPYADPDRPLLQLRRGQRAFGGDGIRGDIHLSQQAEKPNAIDNPRGLGNFIRSCWLPPADLAKTKLDATIRFSLTRDGALVGEPRVTYVSRLASNAQREALTASIRRAVAQCAPFPLSNRFGASAAGRPISIRFIFDAPSTAI